MRELASKKQMRSIKPKYIFLSVSAFESAVEGNGLSPAVLIKKRARGKARHQRQLINSRQWAIYVSHIRRDEKKKKRSRLTSSEIKEN